MKDLFEKGGKDPKKAKQIMQYLFMGAAGLFFLKLVTGTGAATNSQNLQVRNQGEVHPSFNNPGPYGQIHPAQQMKAAPQYNATDVILERTGVNTGNQAPRTFSPESYPPQAPQQGQQPQYQNQHHGAPRTY